MVNVGIIGLGSIWETQYRPALERLRQRVRVSAVYDPVASRAEQVAARCKAAAVNGMLALLERADIQAVLLLGSGWQGQAPLRFVSARRKPVLIAGPMSDDLQALGTVHETALTDGLTVMPEFPRRYTPATGRLQELIATHIGRPEQIVIDASLDSSKESPTQSIHSPNNASPGVKTSPQCEPLGVQSDVLVGLFDWCRYILQTSPTSLQSKYAPEGETKSHGDHSITVEFNPSRSRGKRPIAELRIRERGPRRCEAVLDSDPAVPRIEVICERGRAILAAPAKIEWSTNAGVVNESLSSERSAAEVMLDHFLRRVVGGLIPVADMSDVCHGIRLAQAARRSLLTGGRIDLNGRWDSG